MKFKSMLLSQGSGKVGGLVFSHNKGGNYTRIWRKGTNPNTSQQQALRNALSALQTRFAATLTSAQRAAWAVFGTNVTKTNTLGEQIKLTAQQWYVAFNSLRLQASVAVVDAGPTIYELASATLPVATIVAAGTTASVAYTNTDAWAGEVGGYMLVYASRPQNVTKNFFVGPYRFVGKISGAATPPTSPSVMTLPFVIGATGSRMFFRYVAVRADGRASPAFFQLASA